MLRALNLLPQLRHHTARNQLLCSVLATGICACVALVITDAIHHFLQPLLPLCSGILPMPLWLTRDISLGLLLCDDCTVGSHIGPAHRL